MRGVGYEWNFETELRYLKWMQNLMEPSFLRTRTAGLHQSQGWMIPRDNMRSTSFFSGPRRCSGILKRLHLTIPHLLTQCHLAQGKLKCCPISKDDQCHSKIWSWGGLVYLSITSHSRKAGGGGNLPFYQPKTLKENNWILPSSITCSI